MGQKRSFWQVLAADFLGRSTKHKYMALKNKISDRSKSEVELYCVLLCRVYTGTHNGEGEGAILVTIGSIPPLFKPHWILSRSNVRGLPPEKTSHCLGGCLHRICYGDKRAA